MQLALEEESEMHIKCRRGFSPCCGQRSRKAPFARDKYCLGISRNLEITLQITGMASPKSAAITTNYGMSPGNTSPVRTGLLTNHAFTLGPMQSACSHFFGPWPLGPYASFPRRGRPQVQKVGCLPDDLNGGCSAAYFPKRGK